MSSVAIGALLPATLRLTTAGIFGKPARAGAVHRTGVPVLRGSREAGTFEEDEFFQVPAKGEPDRLLRLAKQALDQGRRFKTQARATGRKLTQAERPFAALTAGAVRVYEEICMLARVNAGRVFPSYEHLAGATALGRDTVARALKVLEAAGFLIRQRRFKRVDGDGPGPRYAQTSNVYRPTLPQRLMNMLPKWCRPAPVPIDELQRVDDRKEDVAHMLSGLTRRELALATVAEGPLQRRLASLGACLDRAERESESNTEALPNSLDQGSMESLRDA